MNSNLENNWIEADLKKFVVFILSHGRPHLRDTYDMLRSCGYSGRIVIIIDNQDLQAEEYYKIYGKDDVYMFDKPKAAKYTDMMNNFGGYNAVVIARNICWDIAKELGYDYFQVLDDDYYYFGHRWKERAKKTICYNMVVKWFVEFLLNTNENVKTIAFAQGGDHIGGYDENILYKRKAMNSFVCLTNRPFKFVGFINEDANASVIEGIRGNLLFTFMSFDLSQGDTQQQKGGLTELYKAFGTYVKSFTTVILAPSCVQVRMMGDKHYRLHHHIKWSKCTPKIISEDYKKK